MSSFISHLCNLYSLVSIASFRRQFMLISSAAGEPNKIIGSVEYENIVFRLFNYFVKTRILLIFRVIWISWQTAKRRWISIIINLIFLLVLENLYICIINLMFLLDHLYILIILYNNICSETSTSRNYNCDRQIIILLPTCITTHYMLLFYL